MLRLILLASGAILLAGCSDSRPASGDLGATDRGANDTHTDRLAADTAATDATRPDTRPRPPAKWEQAASMLVGRRNHTATTLLDGTILVAGGRDWAGINTAERYDPKTNTWSPAGTMAWAHWGHEAVLLEDGRVLVIGGCADPESYDCMKDVGSELYDPKTNTWQKTAPGFSNRIAHRATRLKDGRVLVVGGTNFQTQVIGLEIFDPATSTWSSPAATLAVPRQHPTATLLQNGKVLLAGGWDALTPVFHDSLEVFDPANGSLTALGSKLAEARAGHTGSLLPDGRVLFVGGFCHVNNALNCTVKHAEIYNPTSDSIASAGSIGSNLWGHATTTLLDGRILSTGGTLFPRLAAIFDGSQIAWTSAPQLLEERSSHAAARFGERVLVTGGVSSELSGVATAEIFTP